ncbi:tyrosine-protein phosphatase [Pedobacter sp. MW01-1-1]|uniref:tyrosine-protein phosphatase n=1 Tax=Pedobacter sp. MW01-1-1 TaxID=3383027 RepID=UPI003FEED1CD
MISFFQKKKPVSDLSWMGVDMHSHILPGIDDGSPDVKESLALIKGLANLGLNKFICTPHIFTELYPNHAGTIKPALDLVKDELKNSNHAVEIEAAAEYMVDDTFQVGEGLLCLADNYVLIEMSYMVEYQLIEQVVFDLRMQNYRVILAHPERYNFYHKNHKTLFRLQDMGALFQLNMLSVSGYYGKQVKEAAEYLLKKESYKFIGTDIHHLRHLEAIEHSVTTGYLQKKLENYPFWNKEVFL